MQHRHDNIKATSTIIMEFDNFTSKFSFTSRTAKLRPCKINKHAKATANEIEISLYLSMNQEGHDGDHTTNSSNTQVESEAEVMVLCTVNKYGRRKGIMDSLDIL